MSTPSNAVILPNPLPAQLVALTAELVAKRDELAGLARAVVITDADSLAKAEALFVQVDRFTKDANEGRLVITRQLDALKKKLMETEEQATAPLLTIKQDVARKVLAYREEARKAAAAEAERQRVAAEAAAAAQRAEQEKARKAAEEAAKEAERLRQEEAALFGEAATPAPVPVPVVPVALPVVPLAPVAPVSTVPALPKSAVRTTTRTRCVIDDAAKIVSAACKSEGALYGRQVLLLDEKAVGELLRAGCKVDGARLETYETVGANGGRP